MDLDIDELPGRLGLWPARVVWLPAPLVAGPGLATLLDDRPEGPALAVEIGLWAAWFAVLVSTLVPAPRSLTLCRIAAPAGVGLALIALFARGPEMAVVASVVWTALFTALVFLPLFADRMVNGSAYGSERRMALRPPGFVMVGPVQLAWLAVFAGLVLPGGLLLAERWVAAVVAGVVGAVAVWAGSRVLHQLSGRWVVFVPAGFVIRDPMTLVDAVLLRRNTVAALGPALAGGGADDGRTDISGGARGLALEVALKEPTPISLRVRNEARAVEVENLVFTPSLPGAMLSEARIRGLKIATAAPAG
jgi:hypothetical protein